MIPPGFTLISTAYARLSSTSSAHEAWGILRYLLVMNRLSASSFAPDGSELQVTSDAWLKLSGQGWNEVFSTGSYDVQTDYLGWQEVQDEYQRRAGMSEPMMLVVRQGELQVALESYAVEAIEKDAEVVQTKKKGGRYPKYAKFAATVLRALMSNKADSTKDFAEFFEFTLRNYSREWAEGIDSGVARSMAKILYDVWLGIT